MNAARRLWDVILRQAHGVHEHCPRRVDYGYFDYFCLQAKPGGFSIEDQYVGAVQQFIPIDRGRRINTSVRFSNSFQLTGAAAPALDDVL